MRVPIAKADHETELTYIRSIDPRCPGRAYNYSPAVFTSYVVMQARFAREDGFPDIAQQMRDCVGL